jgi:hypothetical protein
MWREHDSGVVDGGDCGGDHQIGKAPSKRFVRDDLPGSIVTVTIYPIGHSEGDTCVPRNCTPDQIDLEEQIEWLICTDPDDPGGTETWSDYRYESPLADLDGRPLDLPDVATAEREARRLLDSWVPGIVSWDGISTT